MTLNKNQSIFLAVVIVLAIGGTIAYNKTGKSDPVDTTVDTSTAAVTATSTATSSVINTNGVTAVLSNGAEIKIDQKVPAAARPSLDRPITITATLTDTQKTDARKAIEAAIAALKKNPLDTVAWTNLALYRKNIGDFEGARQVWEYIGVVAPADDVPFINLGNLYHFYLKDYPKAEANFFRAIKNNPKSESGYRGLHELYLYSYKTNTTAAADILLQAAAKNPDNPDFLTLLGAYYRDKGDKPTARIYYEKALELAVKFKDDQLKQMVEQELKTL